MNPATVAAEHKFPTYEETRGSLSSASPEAIARFKGEARTAAKLRSRHVVRIFDADVARELGGAPYLVMELLEGSNLDQAAHEKAVEPASVVSWFRQAAVPLERAHRIGIVHRDLKPENLFLTKLDDGTSILNILDFGIARLAESPGMTKSGQLFGTPLYMAPEQLRLIWQRIRNDHSRVHDRAIVGMAAIAS
jgi:serine/threonine-protein kinase